jgi:hypothetical protein
MTKENQSWPGRTLLLVRSSTCNWESRRGVKAQGSSPAPRGPWWLPRSPSQAEGFSVVGGLCSGVSPSMAWHGSSEREGGELLCRWPMNLGAGGEAHPAPSNGRSPRLPPLGLEKFGTWKASTRNMLTGPGPKVTGVCGPIALKPKI